MEQNIEFTLRDILIIIKRYVFFMLILSGIFGTFGYMWSKYLIVPQYQSKATLIVNLNVENEVNFDNVVSSSKMVDIYSVILKNQTFMDKVIQNLNIPVNPSTLAGNVTIKGIGSTGIIELTVIDTNPARAIAIANKIVELAPEEIRRTVQIGTVEPITSAKNAQYISPNNKKNALIAMSFGFVLSLIIVFVLEIINHRFRTKEDIISKIGYPVLGYIPYSYNMKKYFCNGSDSKPKKIPFKISESFNTLVLE